MRISTSPVFFLFKYTAPTEIYTLSLHDALPIYARAGDIPDHGLPAHVLVHQAGQIVEVAGAQRLEEVEQDRKSTRLNSSHPSISYAVFCLKKKKDEDTQQFRDRTCNAPPTCTMR